MQPYKIGSIVEGEVVKIANFGAFVELPNKQTGLVHISEIIDGYVKDINQHIKLGDKVKVKILGINDRGKIDLSIKQTLPPREYRPKPEPTDFEGKLAKFLKESEEIQADYKRNVESKISRNRYRKGF